MELNWVTPKIIIDILDANSYQKKYIQNLIILNQCGLELKKLFTLCEDIYRGNTPKHVEGSLQNGALLLKTVNIRSNELDLGKQFSMTNSVYFEQKRFQLKENDICITIMGATHDIIGRSWVYNKKIGNACFSDGIAKIKNVVIDPYYLSTYLNSKYGHLSIIQFSGSSTRSYITNTQLGEILVPIPSPEIQKYIGDKVRKAEELREEAKRLKKEAEEIFYEAIEIDKLNSKLIKVTKFSWIKENQIEDRLDLKYNSPSIITIYEHFRKYKCSLLKDEFKTISGYAFSSGDFDDMDGEKVIKIGDISDFTIDTTSLTRVKIGTKVKERIREFSCNIQDLVYAMTGATIGKVAMYIDNETVYINQRVACIKPKRNNIPTGYLLLYLNSDIGKEISYSLSTGVAQPNIALEELNNIVIPQLANNIMDKIHHNVLNSLIKHKESKQLIQEAKQDVEDLIEGNFDMSKVRADS